MFRNKQWNGVPVSDEELSACLQLEKIFEEPSQFGSRSLKENTNFEEIYDDVDDEMSLYEEGEESIVTKENYRAVKQWVNKFINLGLPGEE